MDVDVFGQCFYFWEGFLQVDLRIRGDQSHRLVCAVW